MSRRRCSHAGCPIGGSLHYKPANPLARKLLDLVESKRGNGHPTGQTLEAIALELGTTERSLRRWLTEKNHVPRWLRDRLEAKPLTIDLRGNLTMPARRRGQSVRSTS